MVIGGGLRRGQLVLLSGSAGIGKTSFAMQIARNIATEHRAVCLFACYEHETDYLAQRLISMESVDKGGDNLGDGLRLRDIADLVRAQRESHAKSQGFIAAVTDPRGARAIERIARYSQDLLLIKGSSYSTTVAALTDEVNRVRALQGASAERPVVLFVDYLQKVAARTSHTQEEARNVEALEALKELALQQGIVIVAVDNSGPDSRAEGTQNEAGEYAGQRGACIRGRYYYGDEREVQRGRPSPYRLQPIQRTIVPPICYT